MALHKIFNNPFAEEALSGIHLTIWISDNLKCGQRPYHLLYNMATESGKSLEFKQVCNAKHPENKGCIKKTILHSIKKSNKS